ncbi:uncharacterized protein LOC141586750 [Silene latifolia]|uniref:uncharacterized protein LOC141586750 n=1 Tax=Silene latifolia TaxID=37657 RepID=UPI003D7811B0
MGGLWLEFDYKGNIFDYAVHDVDLVQLLDLISDIGDEALKQNVVIPHVYDLYYEKGRRKMHIRSDRDLMTMFDHFIGHDTIRVWIEDTKTPIKQFGVVFELKRVRRDEKERIQREEEERARIEREAVFVEALTMDVPVFDLETNETVFVRVYESQGFSNLNEHAANPRVDTQPPHIKATAPKPSANTQSDTVPIPPPDTTSNHPSHPKYKTQCSQNCPTDDRFASQPSHECNTMPNLSKKPIQSQKKMPKTTAIKKGVYVPKASAKRKGMYASGTSDMKPRRNLSATDDMENYSTGSDDSNDDYCYDEGFDIAKGESDRTYKKGRMYLPQRWGEITLKPWLLFISKDEFMSVFSDYCIQQGFSVVVIKSDRVRYTAECSGGKCTWKIHCSMLPDKKTWAIKKIDGFHKDCFFMKRNPMATARWMFKKLESELKAQPNMPVKYMAEMLMNKYGIEVCTSTMYKVRAVAVTVTGGSGNVAVAGAGGRERVSH